MLILLPSEVGISWEVDCESFEFFQNFKFAGEFESFCRASITFHGQCPVKENTHQNFLVSVLLLSWKDMLIRMLCIVCHVIMKV